MKGAFFHQQIEYRLEVPKDDPVQGDSLPCTLSVRNHGAAPQTVGDLRLDLALGSTKRDAPQDELVMLSSAELKLPWQIDPQQQQSHPWTFQLDKNCPITDKSQTIYFLYGSTSQLGRLPLTVKLHPHIEAVLRTLETSFQFVRKGEKSTKHGVNAKLKAPTSKRFATVDELVLESHFELTTLVLRFVFKVKKFEIGTLSGNVKKDKTQVEQRLDESKYLLPGGFINHDVMDAAIEEALNTVASAL